MHESLIRSRIQASISTKQAFLNEKTLISQLHTIAQSCINSLQRGGKIIFAGNGGSFADAQHLSAEFTSRFNLERRPLASLVLGANASAISAIGNDYGYDQVFARELRGIASVEDVFIALSTSGNSQNIIEAVCVARELGLTTWAFTGRTGGRLADLCECLRIPSDETPRIQECQIMAGHILCELAEITLCGESRP